MGYESVLRDHYKEVRARIANVVPRTVVQETKPVEPEIQETPAPQVENETEKKRPTFFDPRKQIVYDCAEEFGVTVDQILGDSRRTDIMLARRKAMWLMFQRNTMSKKAIGAYLNKDHSSVINAVKKYEENMQAKGEQT